MAEKKLSSRERIINSALSLFSAQGITATTTKQIAENAGVNEVTLFRRFGSKQGLLLAVLQEAPMLEAMQAALANIANGEEPPIATYGDSSLELLDSVPELVRSLIGEAGQFPAENRQALGQALQQANQITLEYLSNSELIAHLDRHSDLSVESAAKLLNTLILGYAIITFSSESHGLWPRSEFLSVVERLFVPDTDRDNTPSDQSLSSSNCAHSVDDCSAELVRSLFQKAKKLGLQAYALIYVLFGAGLRVEEAASLLRPQSLSNKNQHILTLTGTSPRQVPLNRWVMGHRYGTYTKNPLTQWLKSRQDDNPHVFISETGEALGATGIIDMWNTISAETPEIAPFSATPFQARQTWCIELLMKGMSLDNLSILSGLSLAELQAYARRAKEKTALEQALAIDQKKN